MNFVHGKNLDSFYDGPRKMVVSIGIHDIDTFFHEKTIITLGFVGDQNSSLK